MEVKEEINKKKTINSYLLYFIEEGKIKVKTMPETFHHISSNQF